ncbi:hypothetical protein ON010_g3599 [Phytophthora cinnamomi]|nr:hypothetical protein ON010_g3599 [Phytophthora cinnamomi]
MSRSPADGFGSDRFESDDEEDEDAGMAMEPLTRRTGRQTAPVPELSSVQTAAPGADVKALPVLSFPTNSVKLHFHAAVRWRRASSRVLTYLSDSLETRDQIEVGSAAVQSHAKFPQPSRLAFFNMRECENARVERKRDRSAAGLIDFRVADPVSRLLLDCTCNALRWQLASSNGCPLVWSSRAPAGAARTRTPQLLAVRADPSGHLRESESESDDITLCSLQEWGRAGSIRVVKFARSPSTCTTASLARPPPAWEPSPRVPPTRRTSAGPANMFRHTDSNSATLFEMACDTGVWYDISIISPGSGDCTCLEDCKAKSGGKTGFNVPMTVTPKTNVGQGSCAKLDCPADGCSDAYQFPKDDTKTHHCPAGTELDVTFCASGNGGSGYESQQGQPSVKVGVTTPASTTAAPSEEERGAQQQQGSQQQGSQQEQGSQQQQQGSQGTVQTYADLGTVKSKYSYKGENAGNVAGSYNRVKDLASCSKEPVSLQSPVGPMSEPCSLVMRGPMEIENIAVYSDEGGNGTWSRVSSYCRKSGTVENMVFMNNKNIDYSGKNAHGPQGYASEDGLSKADAPTVFKGVLAEASDPSKVGGGPGVSTGAEINIMTGEKAGTVARRRS